MKRIVLAVSILLSGGSCGRDNRVLTRIAFGSCSNQDAVQIWQDVVNQNPQLWIWLGDNIYGDSHDMKVMRELYDQQKSHPGYQQLLKTCPVIGTWDDHDYGQNDGGKFFSKKKESKEELLRFLDTPANDPVRSHDGVYNAHVYGTGAQKVKVILLDTRSFRDTLINSPTPDKRYDPNPEGDILGEPQWSWLEDELKNSVAAVHILGSSIQFISNEHGFEKWGNFPKARQRMMTLLAKYNVKNMLIISGDRHSAEVSKMNVPGMTDPLYDFTSSGLTHTIPARDYVEPNPYRVGNQVAQKNFGMILINWSGDKPVISFEIHGRDGVMWDTPVKIPQ